MTLVTHLSAPASALNTELSRSNSSLHWYQSRLLVCLTERPHTFSLRFFAMEKKAIKKTSIKKASPPVQAASPFDSLAAPFETVPPATSPVKKPRAKAAGSSSKKNAPVKAKAAKAPIAKK